MKKQPGKITYDESRFEVNVCEESGPADRILVGIVADGPVLEGSSLDSVSIMLVEGSLTSEVSSAMPQKSWEREQHNIVNSTVRPAHLEE